MSSFNASETERVRRYLLQKIVHGGNVPVRLPTEMALVETLKLSRVTVRRAISDLLKGHFIQKIPGRQGIYSNPAMVDVTMHSVAILQKINYFDCRMLSILGAMADELQRNNCFCSFNMFDPGNASPENVIAELKNFGFDCIIARPFDRCAEQLLAAGLPVLQLEVPGYPQKGSGNYVSFDDYGFGELLAQKVIDRKLTKVLFFGNLSGIREGFEAKAAGKFEIGIYEEHLNKEGLKEVLQKGNYSGIAAMTREVGLRTLYDALHELPEIGRPELFLYPWKESEFFKKSNPGFYTDIFDPVQFIEQLKEFGKAAAHGVMQLINDLPVDVPPVKMQKY